MEPDGLIPLLPIFETIPTFPVSSKNEDCYSLRSYEILRSAREEAANIRAERSVRLAIRRNIMSAAHYEVESVDTGYAYSVAKKQPISGLRVVYTVRKSVLINDGRGIKKLNISHEMPHSNDEEVIDNDTELKRSLAQRKTYKVP